MTDYAHHPSMEARFPTDFLPHVPTSLASKRTSTSTTKSQLRASNSALLEVLISIQAELHSHKSILLDVQSRVTSLEFHQSPSNVTVTEPPKKTVSRETSTWWQACQAFAANSEQPMSARDFLRTPRPVSGFGSMFEDGEMETPQRKCLSHLSVGPITMPDTPPESPGSVITDESGPGKEDGDLPEVVTPPSSLRMVEVEIKAPPPPPALHSPPAVEKAKSRETDAESPVAIEQGIVAAATATVQTVMVASAKSEVKRALATYEAKFKHKKTEIEHVVLIRFHHHKDML